MLAPAFVDIAFMLHRDPAPFHDDPRRRLSSHEIVKLRCIPHDQIGLRV